MRKSVTGIHCKNSRVAHGASKPRWAPQTASDIPKGVESKYNEA